MIIIGHPWIKSHRFINVFSQEDIQKSKPDDIVLLDELKNAHALASYCQTNQIAYAVTVSTLKDALFANSLGASYMLCKENDALQIQPVAQEYLFDSRILVPIEDEKEIAILVKNGIDGVIFSEAIV